jgi:PhnB protein
MTMKAHPYLNFNGSTEAAFEFYRTVFGGDFQAVLRFRDFPDNPMGVPDADLDRIAHIALPLGRDVLLMGNDVAGDWPAVTMGTNFFICIEPDSAEETDRIFDALADGGSVIMPLEKTDWAERYGMCIDRFDVQWMISYGEPEGSG